jgi:hypothetical protein
VLGARLAVVIVMLVPELEVNTLEQVSPGGHEPMNFAPSLSTSRANWCMISPLDRVIETTSPWVTVMVGLGKLVLFQAETKPTNVIERLAAATLGTGGTFVNARRAATSRRALKEKMRNLWFAMRKLLHR